MSRTTKNRDFDPPDVKVLIRQAKAGDERAFTKLVRSYEDLVFRYAYKLCRDQEKAEEVFQDTFVNVFKRLGQFDERSKFSSWMYAIATNNCLMKHRRSKLSLASISIDAPEGFTDDPPRDQRGRKLQTIASWRDTPLEGVMKEELRRNLDAAIALLPAPYRVVFVLRDIEDKSAEETAKILGLTVPAVKSRLHRARSFLRERLNPYMAA